MARVHPGETVGSWMMKGIMDFLTSDHEDAVFLRNNHVIKLIPMMNPDGVIAGNYRYILYLKTLIIELLLQDVI